MEQYCYTNTFKNRRVKDQEGRSRKREEAQRERLDRLENMVYMQHEKLDRLEDMVYRVMRRDRLNADKDSESPKYEEEYSAKNHINSTQPDPRMENISAPY